MIVCADDYGISPSVSEGIIELIERKRLSATSCMVVGPFADTAMGCLRRLNPRVDIGLHVVLTSNHPLTALKQKTGLVDSSGCFHSFSRLLMNAYKRSLELDAVSKEIDAQIKRFTCLMGHLPHYLDGHQHIQQLPIVREAVTKVAGALAKCGGSIYVRTAGLPTAWLWTKGLWYSRQLALGNCMIALPGKKLASTLDGAGIPHNRFLLGFYDYEGGAKFAEVVDLYLTLRPNPRDILFCHPGRIDDELRRIDPLIDSRLDILQFLGSSRWEDLANESGIRLNTFSGEPIA